MDETILDALILPFDRGLLPLPGRAFLMRGEPAAALAGDWRPRLVCEQSFKPTHDRLTAAGFEAVARVEGRFPAGLLLMTKHKAENRANLARSWSLLEPGGVLAVCGANALGAASFEREVDRAVGLDGHMSKHQARVFWLRRADGPMPGALAEWAAAGGPRPVGDSGFVARPGCFSHDRVDAGSRLLAECFPDGIAGRVADLGSGWGVLAVRLLERFADVTAIDLYEAEALAIEDSRANLARLVPDRAGCAHHHWHDVAAGLPEVAPYDWIVANPPFHQGRAADPALGRAFITAAWKAIRRRGQLLLVANRHLPYEAELRRSFREVETLREAEGYKVILATNRYDRQGQGR